MITVHEVRCTAGAGELVFECVEGCGRRVVVNRTSGRLMVVDPGDSVAVHRSAGPQLAPAQPLAPGA